MFEVLGFTKEQAQEQFGFLLDAFKYGAPPHGGVQQATLRNGLNLMRYRHVEVHHI